VEGYERSAERKEQSPQAQGAAEEEQAGTWRSSRFVQPLKLI
jgi:hypothetical protein